MGSERTEDGGGADGESGALRFDGRVAVVTGAGRGLGREHALLLAARGARVVVNNRSSAPAEAVVAEIADAGGTAVACCSDVGSRDGARAPVRAALERFGRIDILVNNAGTFQFGAFADYPDDVFEQTIDSHLRGSWYATQAAWPQMVQQGYGRVVMIGSRVMIGMASNVAYSAAKGALLGLANSLAVEGAPHGIHVNTLSVAGYTDGVRSNLADPAYRSWMAESLPAWAVAPALAWLVHSDCEASGEFFSAFGHGVSRLFLAEGRGHMSRSDREHTPEAIRDDFDAVYDEHGYFVAPDNRASAQYVSERLGGRSLADHARALGEDRSA
jgi:NAD(P)-dependent dehydrogenase (short-subunit alcohol dehydrogenase family)